MSNIIRTIIPDYVESTTINLLIHTDPGNDIDDEVACGHLLREIINRIKKNNIHLMFSVKTKNVERLLEYGIKPYTNIDLNPTFNFENIIPINSKNTITIVFHDGTSFVPIDYFPHYILSIAPGLDYVIKESNFLNLYGFSHQGLPDTWNGFNDNGSKNIISYMIKMNIPHMITTPFESFKTLFCKETFEKYNIPECLYDRIASEAMNMICGRMSPDLPLNIINFAEGLVNIPFAEKLGKPGTNSRLALTIRSKFNGPLVEIRPEMYEWIHRACVVYVQNIIKSAKNQGATKCPIRQYYETIESLYAMSIALYEMGMPILDESGIRLLYSADGNISSMFPEAFEKFKEIGIYTPAYDLLACLKFISLLETNNII